MIDIMVLLEIVVIIYRFLFIFETITERFEEFIRNKSNKEKVYERDMKRREYKIYKQRNRLNCCV